MYLERLMGLLGTVVTSDRVLSPPILWKESNNICHTTLHHMISQMSHDIRPLRAILGIDKSHLLVTNNSYL